MIASNLGLSSVPRSGGISIQRRVVRALGSTSLYSAMSSNLSCTKFSTTDWDTARIDEQRRPSGKPEREAVAQHEHGFALDLFGDVRGAEGLPPDQRQQAAALSQAGPRPTSGQIAG